MNPDFIFALYVFCMNYHSGQWSRGYRILSRISKRGISLRDSHIEAIQGNRHSQVDPRVVEEWSEARRYYRELKRKYAGKV